MWLWSLVAVSLLCLRVESEEVCYPPCGCFDDDPPFEDRPLPDDPFQQELRFDLYTRRNPDTPIYIHWEDDEMPEEYDATQQTKFLVHGWWPRLNPPTNDTAEELYEELYEEFGIYPDTFLDYGFTDMKNAWLEKYDYNVVIMQWKEGAGYYFYPKSASNARVAGACAAHLALGITEPELVHCTGHSLGGQVCGYMGGASNGTLGRVTGLDPAGPWFDKEDPAVRIDKTDGLFVDNIYTNVNDTFITLGLGRPVGHVDFYPNGGDRQPGCPHAECDHSIVTDYFHASIDTDCIFESYPCDSHEDISAGLCNECGESGCQRMGYYANTLPANGTFFLTTVEDYPHCNP